MTAEKGPQCKLSHPKHSKAWPSGAAGISQPGWEEGSHPAPTSSILKSTSSDENINKDPARATSGVSHSKECIL